MLDIDAFEKYSKRCTKYSKEERLIVSKINLGNKNLILLGSFFLCFLAIVAPATACPVLFQELVQPQGIEAATGFSAQYTIRPQGAHSTWVQNRLREQIGFTPELVLEQVVLHTQERVGAPDEVDLGVLKPTGKTNPDGTERWIPRDDSVLSGSVEVDVRGDGLIVRQKVLRQLRASSEQVAFSLKKKETRTPEQVLSKPSGFEALQDKIQAIAD